MLKRMFSPMLRALNFGLVFVFLVVLPVIAADNQSLDFDVLENTSYDGCPYSGDVAISVKYELTESNIGQLVVSGFRAGQSFELTKKDVEQGSGSAVLILVLQQCIDKINVALKPI
ncbi:hypothetical protein ACWXWU_13560 [Shewanella sp. A14]